MHMASICLVLLTILVGQIVTHGQVCNNGAVMLVQGLVTNEKFVQYCHGGEWQWLCAGNGTWTRVEANVVCRQLGHSGQGSKKGGGTKPKNTSLDLEYFMFGGTSCTGGEINIGDCRGISYRSTCSSKEGWVECQPANCNSGALRLVGGTNREGRVDVCTTQGHWASVCYNEDLADTVCKMLGFPMEGAMANSTTFSIDPKVECTVTDDGNTLNCGDTIQPHTCAGSLVIKCQTHNYALRNTTTANNPTTTCTNNATSAPGAVIGLLVLLEVGTVIAWVAYCTITRKSSPKQRVPTQVNESYTDTVPMEPSYSSLGRNYDTTVTTSDEGIGDYDVIDPKPKPSNPSPVTAEASKGKDEFYNAEGHMYAAINKKKKKVGGEGGDDA